MPSVGTAFSSCFFMNSVAEFNTNEKIMLVSGLFIVLVIIMGWFNECLKTREIKRTIKGLSPDEKEFLKQHFCNNLVAAKVDCRDERIQSLKHKGIVCEIERIPDMYFICYALNLKYMKHLNS